MTITTLGQIRANREAREARAAERAATLPPDDYFAYDNEVCTWNHDAPFGSRNTTHLVCETHWDACLVLLAMKHD